MLSSVQRQALVRRASGAPVVTNVTARKAMVRSLPALQMRPPTWGHTPVVAHKPSGRMHAVCAVVIGRE